MFLITSLHLPPSLAEMAAERPPVALSVSAYCDTGITASGRMTAAGMAGCSPEFPFGTWLILSDGQVLTCEDRGSPALDFHYLDIWTASCDDAIEWGRKMMQVWRIDA